MPIIVKVDKVVLPNKQKGYQVTDVRGLSSLRLPKEYTNSSPSVVYEMERIGEFKLQRLVAKFPGTGSTRIPRMRMLVVNDIILQNTFNEWTAFLKTCGDRLKKINKKNKNNWKGNITIKI